jgi:large subunit ribosomal protein L17
MRHHNANRKFGRERNQRKALLRSLAVALIDKEKIKTTQAKAKEIGPYVEKLITRGKTASMAARRILISRIGSPTLVKKILEDIAPRYTTRKGGYTRITKLPARIKDGSPMAQIEFVK